MAGLATGRYHRGMALRREHNEADVETTRMTIGEHIEELRGCLLRSMAALVVACLACIWPAKYLLELIARPVVLVLRAHGQPDSFLATSPVENLMVYIKVVLIFGVVIAAPYIIYQLWMFVAAGLYRHEKTWVYRLLPISLGLFATGVVFMYTLALLMSLNFLVGFSGWLPLPRAEPTALERMLLRLPSPAAATSQPAVGAGSAAVVPLVDRDPVAPPVGAVWVNVPDAKLKLRGPDSQTYSVQIQRDDRRALVTTHFRIGEYLSFVLVLTIAFGAAFQTPLVVVFLARSGIVPVETFRKYRKVVILVILLLAGMLSPPDLFSHLLLSGPMVALFELGLLLARRGDERAAAGTQRPGAG